MKHIILAVLSLPLIYCCSSAPGSGEAASEPEPVVEFGHWREGYAGMPEYCYTGVLPFSGTDAAGNRTDLPADPYFLLGNNRISVITHVSGIYELMTAERGWARVNASSERPDYGDASASLEINGTSYSLIGLESCASDPGICTRTFGVGFADYDYSFGTISCSRTVSISPSEKIGDGDPYMLIDVTLNNTGDSPVSIDYSETMPVNFVPMSLQMRSSESRNVNYRPNISKSGNLLVAQIIAEPNKLVSIPGRGKRSLYDFYPEPAFLYASAGDVKTDSRSFIAENGFTLHPGEKKTFSIAIGLGDGKDVAARVASDPSEGSGRYCREWRRLLPDLDAEQDTVLRRELLWNSHFVLASAKYSEYYDETFITQGSVYAYHYGDNIAARDLLQASLPACYISPALAKSSIRYVLEHTDIDGEIKRGDCGFGYTQPTIYQESDPQLYIFQAVGEYLRITGDYSFLDETINLYPAESGDAVTVYDALVRNFCYLRDVIGLGRHGLVKLLNSDWSDSFLHKRSPNVTLSSAESHLNTTMALAVVPEFINQMRKAGRPQLADALAEYRTLLLDSFMADMKDRKFSSRAYFGHDVVGDDVVCIEPHSYIFAIDEMDDARKKEIYDYIRPRLEDLTGFRTRERPLVSDYMHGEDGGIWFSLEYPLLLGVATFDLDEAWRLYREFSFDNYAKAYPAYWVGQWTAPDELDPSSHHAGLYDFWTGMSDYSKCFQGFCSHPHTWPLYTYFKLKEFE